MKTIKLSLAIASVCMAFGCRSLGNSGNRNVVIRPTENTPEKFFPENGIALDDNSCKSPMIDSRDGTELLLVSSTNSKGNYRVIPLKYGLKKGELMRIDCKTGRPIGIVKE